MNEVWSDAVDAAFTHRLHQWLVRRPAEEWATLTYRGETLVHLAIYWDGNERAICALIASGLDVNANHGSALRDAAYTGKLSYIRILCAGGANLALCNQFNASALAIAICQRHFPIAEFLMANGMRLKDIHPGCQRCITPELREFERRILRCRSTVIALLRVKRVEGLVRWDKFLLKEIALAVWSSREIFE